VYPNLGQCIFREIFIKRNDHAWITWLDRAERARRRSEKVSRTEAGADMTISMGKTMTGEGTTGEANGTRRFGRNAPGFPLRVERSRHCDTLEHSFCSSDSANRSIGSLCLCWLTGKSPQLCWN
jgi:hypothetical protein